jgi:hypothetical protein
MEDAALGEERCRGVEFGDETRVLHHVSGLSVREHTARRTMTTMRS